MLANGNMMVGCRKRVLFQSVPLQLIIFGIINGIITHALKLKHNKINGLKGVSGGARGTQCELSDGAEPDELFEVLSQWDEILTHIPDLPELEEIPAPTKAPEVRP